MKVSSKRNFELLKVDRKRRLLMRNRKKVQSIVAASKLSHREMRAEVSFGPDGVFQDLGIEGHLEKLRAMKATVTRARIEECRELIRP